MSTIRVQTFYKYLKIWPINCCYNPAKPTLSNQIAGLSRFVDLFTSVYGHFLFLCDFNARMEDV